MQTKRAALGSTAFFLLAPGCVVGLFPWLLTRWRTDLAWLPLPRP